MTINNIIKLEIIVIILENISSRSKFHNGSKYDFKFIIKELTKEFECQFDCLGENTDTFSVPIKEELVNDKTITPKLNFIDTFRFISTSLSKLNNFI